MTDRPGFDVKSLSMEFEDPAQKKKFHAVDKVTFTLEPGKIYGIIGRSGSGKTTLMRLLLRLLEPASGEILFGGKDVTKAGPALLRKIFRPHVRAVFQHPEASLNPAFKVKRILRQPLQLYAKMHDQKSMDKLVAQTLEDVGLNSGYLERYPHELSGGEKKRVSICRALINRPVFLFADEPFAGLDATLQWQIRDVMLQLHKKYATTMVIISHDLHVIKPVSDYLFVMDQGKIVEKQQPDNNGSWVFKNDTSKKLNMALENNG